jgi:hypothetical protein
MNTYISKGTIAIPGPHDITYAICDITYSLNSDDSFMYVFKPNYTVCDLLSTAIFQGIPGLNQDLRKEEYTRTILPTFISERVPSPKREDYQELLGQVNMEYMDPIEYLIRLHNLGLQYSGDPLFVIPYKEKETVSFDHYNTTKNNQALIKEMLTQLCLGNDIIINGQTIHDDNRKAFHDVFMALYDRCYAHQKETQARGIQKAKERGSFKGRKPVQVDYIRFLECQDMIEKHRITARQAASRLGISIDKYYRYKKQLQN